MNSMRLKKKMNFVMIDCGIEFYQWSTKADASI